MPAARLVVVPGDDEAVLWVHGLGPMAGRHVAGGVCVRVKALPVRSPIAPPREIHARVTGMLRVDAGLDPPNITVVDVEPVLASREPTHDLHELADVVW